MCMETVQAFVQQARIPVRIGAHDRPPVFQHIHQNSPVQIFLSRNGFLSGRSSLWPAAGFLSIHPLKKSGPALL